MADDILVERDGPALVITLNRPDVKNALTQSMVDGLGAALRLASRDLAVRAVILTGAGGGFCSGADTRSIAKKEGVFEGASPPLTRHNYTHGVQEMTRAFYACEVPIIAAVSGAAIGLGFDLALQCDIRIADETAVFSEAFISVGLVPGDGGFWYLPRIVGYSRAIDLTTTGRRIDAAMAERWGLVSEVVATSHALATAKQLAVEISRRPPHTVRLSKRLLRDAMVTSLETSLSLGAMAQAIVTGSGDQVEAVSALMERRTPEFTGA